MTPRILGLNPLWDQIEQALSALKSGQPPNLIETTQVDFKEEPGRRTNRGGITPGYAENEQSANYLAREMACMANTPGGGAIILGVADDGAVIGTQLNR